MNTEPLRFRQTLAAVIATVVCACSGGFSEGPTPPIRDAGWADSNNSDAHEPKDVVSEPDLNSDVADASDSAMDSGPEWFEVPSPDRWRRERPCTEPERAFEPVTDEAFEVPDTPDFKAALTKQDFIDVWGSPLPVSYGVFVGSEYGTKKEFQSDVFVEPGEDVTFHIHISQPESDDHFLITPMLDYEPVKATYRRFSSDRTEIIEESAGTGYDFSTVDRFDPVDMTIPAEAFELGRTHEVAIAVRTTTAPFHLRFQYRFSVHYGGFEPPPNRPCFAAPLEQLWNSAQRQQSASDQFDAMIEAYHARLSVAGIFTNPTPRDYYNEPRAGAPREAAPGQTLEIFSTIFRYTRELGPTPVFLQPTLDGRPVGEGWWRSYNGPAIQSAFRYVDARDRFSVTLPMEPGLYHVMLRAFPHPWERWREFESPYETIDSVLNRRINEGSNVLRFRVVAPDF